MNVVLTDPNGTIVNVYNASSVYPSENGVVVFTNDLGIQDFPGHTIHAVIS